MSLFFFFFNDTATTEIYTLSLHDALPISNRVGRRVGRGRAAEVEHPPHRSHGLRQDPPRADPREDAARAVHDRDRKSTRLNSSHGYISYAVFCLKKKNKTE